MIAGPFLKSNQRSDDINKIYKGLSMKNIKSALTVFISIFVLAFAAFAHAAGTYGSPTLDFARGLTPSENANTVAGTSNSAPASGPCTQAWHYRTVTIGPDGRRYIAVYTQACIF